MSTGSAPGEHRGGRVKGTPNRRTVEREAVRMRAAEMLADISGGKSFTPAEHGMAAFVEAATATTNDIFTGTAHDFLVLTYKDCRLPRAMRMDAAKAAIRYETPALAATTLVGDADNPVCVRTLDTRSPMDARMTALLLAAQVPVITHDVDDQGNTTDTVTT